MIKQIEIKGGKIPSQSAIVASEMGEILEKSIQLEEKIRKFQPFDKQIQFLENTDKVYDVWNSETQERERVATVCLWCGALGAAKSTTLMYATVLACAQNPGLRVLVIRKTMVELSDSTADVLLSELFPMVGIMENEDYVHRKNKNEIWFRNGSKILFRGCDQIHRFRSVNCGLVVIDELDEIEEGYFDELLKRIRQKNIPIRKLIAATNPPNTDHWIYRRFAKNKLDNYSVVHTSIDDNPHLDAAYVNTVKQNLAPFPGKYRALVLGMWGMAIQGRPVYENEYYPQYHVAGETLVPVPGEPLIRGWDFGGNYPCIIIAQPVDGRVNFLWMHQGRPDGEPGISLNAFSDFVISRVNTIFSGFDFIDVGDVAGRTISPEAGKSSIQILKERHKIDVITSHMGLLESIELVGSLFTTMRNGKAIIQIDPGPQMRILREALEGGYHYPDKPKAGKKDLEPVKDGYYEHSADTARYILYHVFRGKLSQRNDMRRKMILDDQAPLAGYDFRKGRRGYGIIPSY